MVSFNQFIQSFSKDEKKKGKQFEYFVKDFLKDDRHGISKIKKVWSFKDAPINWGADLGTDLIFEDYDGKYWAVQAKKYDPENTVTKEDINSFISDSNRSIIHKRLLIISTNKIANNGLKTINAQEKEVKIFRLQNFEDMGDIFPEKLSDLIKLKHYDIPTPKPHQTEAIEDVLREFQVDNKGQLIMACGTGKTFTCFWIHQRLKSKKTLVLLPSLNLMSQMLKEWIFANGSSFHSLCVCSDSTTIDGIQEDEIIIDRSDLPYSVTSDVNEIKSFLSRKEPTVLFSTYQSSPLIAEAQAKLKSHYFELSIADEAHRCAGKVSSNFATILDDKKIRSNKKLFTTATPRIYSTGIKKMFGFQDIKVTDMEDVSRFGKVFHYFPFSKAIEKKQLADYKVIILGIDKSSIKEMIEKREFVSFSNDNLTDSKSLANQIGFIKAMNDYNLGKIITFHGRVKKSKDFSEIISKTFSWIKPEFKPNKKLITSFVEGKMKTTDRLKKIKLLKESKKNEVCVLSNARCLGEGVDVPSLDAISFIDPKTSDIDIVQCIGRAIRKPSKKKKFGYIILPVYIAKNESTSETIEGSDFKYIWHILNALKAHDDDLRFELDQIRTNHGKKGIISKPSKIIFDLPTKVSKSFQNEINTYLINKITDSWNLYFGLLQKYYTENKTVLVPQDSKYKGYNLGSWCNIQRFNFKKKKLPKHKFELLDSLYDWSWSPKDNEWEQMFKLLNDHFSKNPGIVIKVSPKNKKLHQWIVSQRTSYQKKRLPKEKINRFKKNFGEHWTWDVFEYNWMRGFNLLEDYFKKFKKIPSNSKTKFKDFRLGTWVANQRKKFKSKKLSKIYIDKLELTFKKDWTWDPHEEKWIQNLKFLKEYFSNTNSLDISKNTIFKSFNLSSWIAIQRQQYKNGNLSSLKIKKIEKTFGDHWTWDPFESKWSNNFEILKEYFNKNNTIDVSMNFEYKGLKLNTWINTQRNAFTQKILPKDRINKIEETFKDKWSWHSISDQWDKNFELTKEYYSKYKKLPLFGTVFKGINIGNWTARQRTKKNHSNYEKKISLIKDTFGTDWSWNPIDDAWENNFNLLAKYYQEFKTSRIKAKEIYMNVNLGSWVDKQRQNLKKKKLSKERKKKLENSFPDWKW